MKIQIIQHLDDIDPVQWNRLVADDYPFLRHEFLAALEHNDCVGKAFGWLPHHITVCNDQGELIGACPLYVKDNSYGEFVFDWAWAEAYERSGKAYYPKAVCAIPYTPATGPRLLVRSDCERNEVVPALIETALEFSRASRQSSLHYLFTDRADTQSLKDAGLMLRLSYQFHWTNPGYRDFEDFLDAFTAKKRKNLKRERRRVLEQGFSFRIVHGDEASDHDIRLATFFYASTFDKKWGTATLNEGFFQQIAASMGKQLVLIFAELNGRSVAGAICFRSNNALYGRHWGCFEDYHSLHFETCYYQGIDYCIEHQLRLFEPGAQGEHKISRGFLPTPTWSAHWIADSGFHKAVADFLVRETRAIREHIEILTQSSPYHADKTPELPDHFPLQLLTRQQNTSYVTGEVPSPPAP